MSNSKLGEEVRNFFSKEGMIPKLDPMDQNGIQNYIDTIVPKLPELYRRLEAKGLLPDNATYQGFLQVFEFQFNAQRSNAIFGDFL